jgi:peptide/nickel transport system permease protein
LTAGNHPVKIPGRQPVPKILDELTPVKRESVVVVDVDRLKRTNCAAQTCCDRLRINFYMWAYVIRRLLAFIPTMFFVVTLVFVLTRLIPGDPAGVLAGHQLATEERIEQIRRDLGLDQPILVQYTRWLSRAVRGDFGNSIFFNEPVTEVVLSRLPVTLSLAFLSLALTVLMSIPLGILAATRRNTAADAGAMIFSVLGISFPPFWLGFIFILLFSVTLRWLPTSGYRPWSMGIGQWFRYMILPSVSLCLSQIALLTRTTRASMLEVLGKEYITTAQAKGLTSLRVIYGHALQNAMISVVTVAGLAFAVILGGSIIIESVFALPGVGRLVVNAALRRDYPGIQGSVTYLVGIALLDNLLVDLSYALINPRITYE